MRNLESEGKLIVRYVYKETKMEEFFVNHSNVSQQLTQAQFGMPITTQMFLEFTENLHIRSEEDAEEALKQLEGLVSFSKPNIELLNKAKYQKLEKRINNILPCYDLRGKIGLLKQEVLKKYWTEDSERLVLINGGFGAEPNKIGRTIFVTFLSDFEELRFKRDDLECIFCDKVETLLTVAKEVSLNG